ncbi:Na(+)/H(+) antiporter subunit C [Actinomycetospora endophytica]|uniref:Na(+)/H(+) antiporter subunit C n=1 Tax=Actinomycetospora endophytica TaxID=2291215 RepID=A0ABS8P340_9PSEU|nr:Na(+)/H(+) antiporter subunit C [Actinomycetospora endophytica]MCD2192648.1 Na(+)/H(+) antiporter subunit C [Actinomycetospora endophytica]
MSTSLLLLVVIALLYTAGIYLVLDRSLTRVLLGVLVLGNATNLLVISAGGPFGAAALVGRAPEPAMSDALVQALVLTAIVITLGVAAFLLSIIHRTWTLDREDDLTEDTEDRSVRRRLASGEQVDEDELDTTGCEATSDTDDERARSAAAGGGS